MSYTELTTTERERATAYLIRLKKDLENKQKYHHSTYHDQNYFGIKDIDYLLKETIDDYYEPILVRFAFDNNFEEYEIRGDKIYVERMKKLTVIRGEKINVKRIPCNNNTTISQPNQRKKEQYTRWTKSPVNLDDNL